LAALHLKKHWPSGKHPTAVKDLLLSSCRHLQ
jgi:hypothetical protein